VILIEIKRTKVEEKAENILLEIYPTLKNYTNAEKYRLCEKGLKLIDKFVKEGENKWLYMKMENTLPALIG